MAGRRNAISSQSKVHSNYGVVQQPQIKPKYKPNLQADIANTHNIQNQNDQNKVAKQQSVPSKFIDKWLTNIGMGKYINLFKNQYNFKTMQDLKTKIKSISYLTKMGIESKDAEVIGKQVNKDGGNCVFDIAPEEPQNEGFNYPVNPRDVGKTLVNPDYKPPPKKPKPIPPIQNKQPPKKALPGHMTPGGGGVRAPGYLKQNEGDGDKSKPALPGNTKNGQTPITKANDVFDNFYSFEDGYDGYYGYDDLDSFQGGYQGYDGYDNYYGHYMSYDNDKNDDLYSFQDGYPRNGGYDNQYGHYISYDDGMNDNHDNYDGVAVFAVGALTGIILLCCICALCGGISIISCAIGKYLDKYVSKRKLKNKGMISNDNNRCIESEIDHI